jgi:uncharacterized protein YprB with RNaseH-like and TPR domain
MAKKPALSDDEVALAIGGELVADGLARVVTRYTNVQLCHRLNLKMPNEVDFTCLLGANAKLEGLLSIDTETTGLSGGSGTVAFNVGCAQIVNNEIIVTQFVLMRYGGERAMLDELTKILAEVKAIVTYNGKTFDLPLLVTRYRMQRRRAPFDQLAHFDLLHPTRSLFGRSWRDCRLTTVEEEALGFRRKDDLPGFLVPATWADFLRDRQPEGLKKVIEHNEYDVVSLLALTVYLARIFAGEITSQVDALALARALRKRGQRERSLQLLESQQQHLAPVGQLELAREWRRLGRESEALSIWERLAADGLPEAIESCAKFHEHSSKDLPAALRYTEALIASSGRQPPHLHRLERLSRKLAS